MDPVRVLQQIPNIGPASAKDLVLLGIKAVADLEGKSADDLYVRLCRKTGQRQDPCVHDTLAAAIHFAETGESKVWWDFTPERKRRIGDCRSLLDRD